MLPQQASAMRPTCSERLLTLEVTTSLEAQKPQRGFPEAGALSFSAHRTANRRNGERGAAYFRLALTPASFAGDVCV